MSRKSCFASMLDKFDAHIVSKRDFLQDEYYTSAYVAHINNEYAYHFTRDNSTKSFICGTQKKMDRISGQGIRVDGHNIGSSGL